MSVLELQIGNFLQISTELRPLIDVRNWFSLSIFAIPLPIFFKLGMRVDIGKECPWIADGDILANKYTELQPLIDVRFWFSLSIFGIPRPIFFKLGIRVDIGKECPGIADG